MPPSGQAIPMPPTSPRGVETPQPSIPTGATLRRVTSAAYATIAICRGWFAAVYSSDQSRATHARSIAACFPEQLWNTGSGSESHLEQHLLDVGDVHRVAPVAGAGDGQLFHAEIGTVPFGNGRLDRLHRGSQEELAARALTRGGAH